MPWTSEFSVGKTIADIALFILIATSLVFFNIYAQPFWRGFYCTDESIRYPLRDETVPTITQLIIVVAVPTVTVFFMIYHEKNIQIICVELARYQLRKCLTSSANAVVYKLGNCAVHETLVNMYRFLGAYFLGAFLTKWIVDIAKLTVGRLRPNFLAVCQPRLDLRNCDVYGMSYISDYECTGTDIGRIRDARFSFFSGHASSSFFLAAFVSLYLHCRLQPRFFSRACLSVIQFALFGAASFVAYSRISNFMHHWSDVLFGAMLGSIAGVFSILYIANGQLNLNSMVTGKLTAPVSGTHNDDFELGDPNMPPGFEIGHGRQLASITPDRGGPLKPRRIWDT